jgi:hypothetical protein
VLPIRRLYNACNALIAERNALAAELAAIQAALLHRDKQLTRENFGRCCLYTAYDQKFAPVAAHTIPAMRRYAERYGFDFAEHVDQFAIVRLHGSRSILPAKNSPKDMTPYFGLMPTH